MNRRAALEQYLRIVRAALERGIVPRCHFEDITRADIAGFCIPFATELMRLREESGIDVKIRLCDTLGFGVTYPGAALPRSVPKLVRAFIDDAGFLDTFWNGTATIDFHKVLVNAADRVALWVQRSKRDLARVRQTHRQRPHRRPDLRVHRVQGHSERDGHNRDHRHRRILSVGTRLYGAIKLSVHRQGTSMQRVRASMPTGW